MPFEVPVHLLQPAFSRGEVNPRLFGRVDLTGWSQGLRTLRNGTVSTEGCVINRPGFGFVGNAVTPTPYGSILVPFIFSATQSYVLEIGPLSAQVFSQGSVVSTTPSAISAAALVRLAFTYLVQITTPNPHGLTVGQNVVLAGIVGTGSFAAANGINQVVSVPSPTQFTVQARFGNTGVYTSGGTFALPLTFATPWASADLPLLRWSQSSDTLTLVHQKYPPYEIKRTSANSFTCLQAVYANGPFLPQNPDGVTFVYASAKSGTVTLTATAPIFNANHVGGLFQLTQQDLSIIPPWEPTKQFSASTIVGQYRRASLKNYLAVSLVSSSPGTTNATGTWLPSHSQGTQADGDGQSIPNVGTAGVNWEYQDSGSGVVLITGYVDPQHVTGVVQPNYTGGPGLLPISCVGGPVTAFGPFTFNGTGAQTTFSPLTGVTSTDPSKFFVTVNGVYQPPPLYSISGTTITFLVAPPAGTNNVSVTQISQLGQTTFWAFGAFSAAQGYPRAVSYFPDRLVLAGTTQQPVGVFGSRTSLYHDMGVSNPVVASDAFAVFLNARQLNAITDLIPLSDLMVGTTNIIWRLWPGSTGVALSPLAIASTPQSYYGESPNCAGLLFGDSGIFPEFDGRRLRDLIYQFAFDKFMGQEITLYSRHLIPKGTQFTRLAYKPDVSGQLVFGLLSSGALIVCTYLREQQMIGWGRFDTLGSFEDICVVPEGNTYRLYAIVNRTIGGATVRYVEELEEREAATLFDLQFLDCNLTYDGRNTSSTTMVLTGAPAGWLAGGTGTLMASGTTGWATFLATDVGNEIWLNYGVNFTASVQGATTGKTTVQLAPGGYVAWFPNGETRYLTIGADSVTATWQQPLSEAGSITTATFRARCVITAVSGPTLATVRFKDPVPSGLQGGFTANWTFARANFAGATQIAGQAVVAYADGNVLGMHATSSSADGSLVVDQTGAVTLPNPCGVVQLGLPYLFDFETLPLNLAGQETIRMRAKAEPVIYLDVTDSRYFLAGTDFSNLMPAATRAFETYVAPNANQQGILWVRVPSELSSECHTCIRQNMPLPITIRGVIPSVGVGEPVS